VISSDFSLSYLAKDAEGQEVYLSMLSDWDMDAAFQCAADPCLKLKVDLKPFDQGEQTLLFPTCTAVFFSLLLVALFLLSFGD
jgi:hypothetical protein